MRNLLAGLLIMFTALSTAQNWLDVGLKGGGGVDFLLNKNILDDNSYNHRLTGGYTFGGKLGLNFGNMHEVTFDVMYTTFNQKFQYNFSDTAAGINEQYFRKFSYSAIDLLLMYRMNNEGRYFEIGPKLSLNRGGKNTNDDPSDPYSDVSSLLNGNSYGAAIGFGNYFFGTENFGITLGLRIAYDFTDLFNLEGTGSDYPGPIDSPYPSYAAGNPLTIQAIMEFNFDFGYLATASCGKRTKLIMF